MLSQEWVSKAPVYHPCSILGEVVIFLFLLIIAYTATFVILVKRYKRAVQSPDQRPRFRGHQTNTNYDTVGLTRGKVRGGVVPAINIVNNNANINANYKNGQYDSSTANDPNSNASNNSDGSYDINDSNNNANNSHSDLESKNSNGSNANSKGNVNNVVPSLSKESESKTSVVVVMANDK